MFLINAVATVAAAVIVVGIYAWLQRREMQSAWGDVRSGIWMALVRAGIFQIEYSGDAKKWRPHLLVLSGAPTRRWNLIEFASALTHNRGLVTVSSVLLRGGPSTARQTRMENTIREYLDRRGVQALVRLISAPDPFEGAERLVEAYGFGPLVPNTLLLGDSKDPDKRDRYADMISHFHRARRNVVILHDDGRLRDEPAHGFRRRERIDVWWGGLKDNGALMMILAYLLRTSTEWRGAEVNVKLVVPNEMAAESAGANLRRKIDELRIGAEPHVIIGDGRPFDDILRKSSAAADLIFLGMAEPADNFAAYIGRMHELVEGLPTVAFVLAAEDLKFAEVLL
jgi:hypothetical protein